MLYYFMKEVRKVIQWYGFGEEEMQWNEIIQHYHNIMKITKLTFSLLTNTLFLYSFHSLIPKNERTLRFAKNSSRLHNN